MIKRESDFELSPDTMLFASIAGQLSDERVTRAALPDSTTVIYDILKTDESYEHAFGTKTQSGYEVSHFGLCLYWSKKGDEPAQCLALPDLYLQKLLSRATFDKILSKIEADVLFNQLDDWSAT